MSKSKFFPFFKITIINLLLSQFAAYGNMNELENFLLKLNENENLNMG